MQSNSARKKVALITGIGGQIGSYLAPFLLERGYEVHGISRSRDSLEKRPYACVYKAKNLTLHYGALADALFIEETIKNLRPDEIYNLGAQSVVAESWDLSELTCETNFMGLLYLLNAIHKAGIEGSTRIFQKFAHGIAKVKLGLDSFFYIGNPETVRDWGHVSDVVNGMWLALQYHRADDFVFAAGNPHSIRDFVQIGFDSVGLELRWEGDGDGQVGIDANSGNVVVKVDPKSYGLPSHDQWGDPSKALRTLGWKREYSFDVSKTLLIGGGIDDFKQDVVKEMVSNAMSNLQRGS
ncbi:MAG: hypothetical protein M1821_004458 [Bathelium mastoideum]|nr:MAG: hypothetical protein M1821_004458 [Bathelium mastoideum]